LAFGDNDLFPTIARFVVKIEKKRNRVSSVFLAPLLQSLEDPHYTRTKLGFMLLSSPLILWKDKSDVNGLKKKKITQNEFFFAQIKKKNPGIEVYPLKGYQKHWPRED